MRERAVCLLVALAACATAGPPNATGDDDTTHDASVDSGTTPDGSCQNKTWYRDGDEDMHGDPAMTMMACDQPAGMVAAGDDCDDANPGRHPGATELCDGVDNDCNAGAEPCPSSCSIARRPAPDDAKVYLFCTSSTSYTSARSTCISAGMQLVAIESAAENVWVYNTALSRLGDVDYHIGASDLGGEGVWKWEGGAQFWSGDEGGAPVGGRYSNWESGEPNDSSGEDCAEVRAGARWNDHECSDFLRYVCRN